MRWITRSLCRMTIQCAFVRWDDDFCAQEKAQRSLTISYAAADRVGWSTWLVDDFLAAHALQGHDVEVASMLNYGDLVYQHLIAPPEPYASLSDFNSAIAEELSVRLRSTSTGEYQTDVVNKGITLTGGAVDAAIFEWTGTSLRSVDQPVQTDLCGLLRDGCRGKPPNSLAVDAPSRNRHRRRPSHPADWLYQAAHAFRKLACGRLLCSGP